MISGFPESIQDSLIDSRDSRGIFLWARVCTHYSLQPFALLITHFSFLTFHFFAVLAFDFFILHSSLLSSYCWFTTDSCSQLTDLHSSHQSDSLLLSLSLQCSFLFIFHSLTPHPQLFIPHFLHLASFPLPIPFHWLLLTTHFSLLHTSHCSVFAA